MTRPLTKEEFLATKNKLAEKDVFKIRDAQVPIHRHVSSNKNSEEEYAPECIKDEFLESLSVDIDPEEIDKMLLDGEKQKKEETDIDWNDMKSI